MNDIAISTDGVPIHFDVQGEGATTLLFVHGWSCNRRHWQEQVSYFAQQYRVVTIDLAGHGASGLGRTAWTMAAFGEDVVAVANKVGLEKMVLVGHSMGGMVIIEAARRIPERVIGLVTVDTLRDVDQSRSEAQIVEILAPFRVNFVEAARELVHDMFLPASDPTLVERIVSEMSAVPPEVGIGALQEIRRNDQNLREGILEMSAPIAAINSDYKVNNVEAAQRYGIKMLLMSGVGHFVMMEDVEAFNGLLDDVVKRMAPLKMA